MPSQRTHDVIITSLLRRNDVATSFWRNYDVIGGWGVGGGGWLLRWGSCEWLLCVVGAVGGCCVLWELWVAVVCCESCCGWLVCWGSCWWLLCVGGGGGGGWLLCVEGTGAGGGGGGGAAVCGCWGLWWLLCVVRVIGGCCVLWELWVVVCCESYGWLLCVVRAMGGCCVLWELWVAGVCVGL